MSIVSDKALIREMDASELERLYYPLEAEWEKLLESEESGAYIIWDKMTRIDKHYKSLTGKSLLFPEPTHMYDISDMD